MPNSGVLAAVIGPLPAPAEEPRKEQNAPV
jgi:hypothetical protein